MHCSFPFWPAIANECEILLPGLLLKESDATMLAKASYFQRVDGGYWSTRLSTFVIRRWEMQELIK